jgi:type I restriction-modification system DNA methylase subunit
MSSEYRKQRLSNLITEYTGFKEKGKLDLTSEETIRTWLNQFLEIFGWDVRDTSQILQEKVLSKTEKEQLISIGSTNTRPDYTFKIAKQKLTFLDAKDISVNIKNDTESAFQIKSYGWSILAPCAFISNFEEFAIYDCTYTPVRGQNANFGCLYFSLDNYLDNFEILEKHLLKENIYKGVLAEIYSSTLKDNRYIEKITPDLKFAKELSEFRLALAADILENNPDYIQNNATNLSYITQVIINRVLFIRVCEARKIEEDGLLNTFKENGFWGNFKDSSYFNFYDHYDGPLFDRITEIHQLNISDSVFDILLQHLYYPSPYRFDVIPTKLLSDIYEIFLSRKLLIEDSVVKDEIKSEYTKTKGAVSTPQYIVQEIIRRTILKSHLQLNGIENIFSQKILDIACGSGVFAIEAYDYIEDNFKELFIATGHPEFIQYFHITETDTIVNLLGKKAILDNCIFGVDIDAEAVEVTKMSLSLKIIDSSEHPESYNEIGLFGSKILHGIGNNIRCGNSLVESDILDLFPDIENNQEELLRTNIFDWDSEHGFSEIFHQKGGFDYIIGNPPYVEVKNYNTDLPFMHQYIKEKFPSAKNGKIDLAIPFIELSVKLLNPSGRLGFIIQKRFFKTDYGKKIREIISGSSYLSSVIDFDTTAIFKDRITYVTILILDRLAPDHFSYKLFKDKPETLQSELREVATPDIAAEEYTLLPSTSLSGSAWNFGDNNLIAIRTKLLELGCLGDYAVVRVGIQSLWNDAYHIRPISLANGILTGKTHLEDSFEIELDACCALLPNEHFYSFRDDTPETYCIFPYVIENGVSREIPFTLFNERFPLAGAYLLRNKEQIQLKVETFPGERWHCYTRANNIARNFPKIYIPMTAQDTFGAITYSERHYCDNANVNYIELPQINEINLQAMAAIINSTIFSVLARSIANPQTNGYFKFNKQFLEPVPFPVGNFTNNAALKAQLARSVMRISTMQIQHSTSSPSQKRGIEVLLNREWNTIDDLCYELYELSQEEKDFFRERNRNINRIQILHS